jgi:O-antigen ligase
MKGLLLTYLLGYGGAAASIFNPVIGLFVYTLFSIVRPQNLFSWAGDLSGMSFYVGTAMGIGWVVRGGGNWRFGQARLLVILLLAYFFWYMLSAALAPDQTLAWNMVMERSKVVLAFMVGITMLDSQQWLRRFAWLVVLAHGYLGFEMNLSYLRGVNEAAEGLLGDNNSFAISMVASLGPAIFLGVSAERLWQKGLAFGSAALIMHTVLLTYSRGGILAMMITGVIVLITMPKRPSYLLGVLVVAALAVRFTGPELAERFKTTFAAAEERDASARSRLDLWRDCLTLMGESPLVGVGPAHFPRVSFRFGWTKGKQAHSTWMQLGAETGIPTLMALLGFFTYAALCGLRLAWRYRQHEIGVYGLYTFSGLVGYMIAAQFVSIEGLEVPFYVALVTATALKLQSSEMAQAAAEAAAPVVPAWAPPQRHVG